MCTSKPPTPKDPEVKDPQYMRNPWLDGLSMQRTAAVGRNELRTDSGATPSPGAGLDPAPPVWRMLPPPGSDAPPPKKKKSWFKRVVSASLPKNQISQQKTNAGFG